MMPELNGVNSNQDDFIKRLGLRLKELRAARSQEVFAKHVGVSLSTLRRFESGERVPDSEQIFRICKLEEVSANWLFGGSNRELSMDEREALGLPLVNARDDANSAAASEASGANKIAPALMRAVIQAALTLFQEEDLHLPPEKFAELCMLAYELERNAAKPDPRARVVQLMRLAA